MPKQQSKKSVTTVTFQLGDKPTTILKSLLDQVKCLVGPLSELEKVLRSTDSRSDDYPWSEVSSCLASARNAWMTHSEHLQRNLIEATATTEDILNQQRSTLQQRFMEKTAQCGWTIQGSWPEPVVDQVVFLNIDSTRGKALVNGRSLGSLSLDQLVKAIEMERSTLLTKDFDPVEWLTELSRAYDRARSARGLPDGEATPVFEILPQIAWSRQKKKFFNDPVAENFMPYSVVRFRADLTRTLAADVTQTLNGRRLEISSGSFTKDAIFMYFPSTRHLGSCGRIAFFKKTKTLPTTGSRNA